MLLLTNSIVDLISVLIKDGRTGRFYSCFLALGGELWRPVDSGTYLLPVLTLRGLMFTRLKRLNQSSQGAAS